VNTNTNTADTAGNTVTNTAGYRIADAVANIGAVKLALSSGLDVSVSLHADTIDGTPPVMALGDYTSDIAGVLVTFRISAGEEFGSPVLSYSIVIGEDGAVTIGGVYMAAGQIVTLDDDARATGQTVPAVAREYIRSMATLI